MAFVAIFSQIKLLFGPLVIEPAWYILKQLFTSVSVKVVDISVVYCESVNLIGYIIVCYLLKVNSYASVHIVRHV